MSFVDTLISFLEVAIHTVLHARGVYPPQVFELRKKYNLPVRMSSAPALSRYIGSALSDPQLRNWIQHGFVERLVLAIKSAKHSNRVVERFVFEFAGAVANMSSSSCDTTEHGNLPVDAVKNSAGARTAAIGSSDAVEELLRQSLIRLAGCDRLLRPALPGCTFSLLFYTRGVTLSAGTEDQVWVEASGKERCEHRECGDLQDPEPLDLPGGHQTCVVPLKEFDCGGWSVRIYATEIDEKA